ncbi:hypothetical protein RB653_007409 [Dictyostelium firmibasis]|uniref:Cyclin-like domain-containing protein n=1 Tax=Dictyostelium firmibasis TaxID=79012 RepID=A0AAN7TVC2_9MYCE
MSYNESSQIKNWMFSNERLKQLREQCNNQHKQVILEKTPSSELNILCPDEELSLIHYYETKTLEIAMALNLPDKVSATAIIYIKRFYLENSIMQYGPKLVMLSCLFIACKTEDNHLDIDYYSNITKASPSDITNLEVIILESLNFNLIVYHPFRPMYGYILDINDNFSLYNNTNGITPVKFDTLWETCKKSIQKSLFSDCCFEFHPQIIALACLNLNWDGFNMYIENKFKDKDQEFLNSMIGKINQVKEVLSNVPDKPDLEVVKKIDRKLIFLNNPEKEKRKSKKDPNKNPKKKTKPSTSTPPTSTDNILNNDVTTTTTTTAATTLISEQTTTTLISTEMSSNTTTTSTTITDTEMVNLDSTN